MRPGSAWRCAAAAVLVTAGVVCCAGLASAGAPYPACPTGLTCGRLSPGDLDGMTFDCATADPKTGPVLGNVFLMHGDDGRQSKGMWAETMLQLAELGFHSLACDLRGFSPGASPDEPSAYNYDLLAGDILSLTNAGGFNASFGGKFHLVTHDQGARVAWHSIAKGLTRDRLLSFASLSIPHADVFSSNVCCGSTADTTDQVAQQYVRQLTLNNSVDVNGGAILHAFCGSLGFNSSASCQPSFWWYNGAIDAGAMALAPLMPFGHSIAAQIKIPFDMVKKLTPYPLDGVPQRVKVGDVSEFPVFFACGQLDRSDLCSTKVVHQTAAMISSPFTSAINSCGHQLIAVGSCPIDERQKVIGGISDMITSVTPSL